jgi:DNA transformation protein
MSDSGFVSHCLELLSALGPTSSRRMFGGHALYVDGLCMALVIQDTLYLKVDDAHRALFENAGCRPFTYAGKNGQVHVTSYCTAPEAAMESPAEMLPWARRALSAAVAARAKAPPAKSKKAAAKAPVGRKSPASQRVARAVVAETRVARKPVKP